MYTVIESEAISRDMSSLLFSSTFKHSSNGAFMKRRELLSSDLYQHHQHHQQQQHQQLSSGLMRYRSAPSSFFAGLLVDGISGGVEDFLNHRSPSPESDAMFATFVSCSGSANLDSNNLNGIAHKNLHVSTPMNMKQETPESVPQTQFNGFSTSATPMVYESSLAHDLPNHNSLSTSFSVAAENPMRASPNNGNSSNLIRQSSSPAGFVSEFAATREVGNFRASNGTSGQVSSSTCRLNNHTNFSSAPSSCSMFMPQIAENGNESTGTGSPDNRHLGNANDNNGCYVSSFSNDYWNDSTFTSLKRNRDGDVKMLSGFSGLRDQNGGSRSYTPGLTHHLSLPRTSAEMTAIEKYLQVQQDSVPCKIRAKRGCATHPRSIAERMRRTRISERMRKLQELFPNMDKQTNTADMLDLAVDHIKDLQKQVQTLSDRRAKCTCSSKQKQYSGPTA